MAHVHSFSGTEWDIKFSFSLLRRLVENARFGRPIPSFCKSLVENTRFGSVDRPSWRQSRGKRGERRWKGKQKRKAEGQGKGKGKGKAKSLYFLLGLLCFTGVRSTTWLLEGERAQMYVPICCCDIGMWVFQFSFFA